MTICVNDKNYYRLFENTRLPKNSLCFRTFFSRFRYFNAKSTLRRGDNDAKMHGNVEVFLLRRGMSKLKQQSNCCESTGEKEGERSFVRASSRRRPMRVCFNLAVAILTPDKSRNKT